MGRYVLSISLICFREQKEMAPTKSVTRPGAYICQAFAHVLTFSLMTAALADSSECVGKESHIDP